MNTNDQRLIEGLFTRIDRLVSIMEGKYCPETSGETWLRAEDLLKLPQFRHRKGRVWLYKLAKTAPEIMKKDCLPAPKAGRHSLVCGAYFQGHEREHGNNPFQLT